MDKTQLTERTNKKFVDYLSSHDLLDAFVENFDEEFAKGMGWHEHTNEILVSAFDWEKTSQGYAFWKWHSEVWVQHFQGKPEPKKPAEKQNTIVETYYKTKYKVIPFGEVAIDQEFEQAEVRGDFSRDPWVKRSMLRASGTNNVLCTFSDDTPCLVRLEVEHIAKANTDPKGAAGALKPQLQLIPPSFEVQLAAVLALGATKYGAWNWRKNNVELMTYLGAMRRHIGQILDGEDVDSESGQSHLAHVAAGCAIVLDAAAHNTLVDNRPTKL